MFSYVDFYKQKHPIPIHEMGLFSPKKGDEGVVTQERVQTLIRKIQKFVDAPLTTACDMRPDDEKESTSKVVKDGVQQVKAIAAGDPTATSSDDLDAEKENVSSHRGPGAGS
jgi:hypothetical protein